jgi:hypothetical protein
VQVPPQGSGSVALRAVIASKPNSRIAANSVSELRSIWRLRRMFFAIWSVAIIEWAQFFDGDAGCGKQMWIE